MVGIVYFPGSNRSGNPSRRPDGFVSLGGIQVARELLDALHALLEVSVSAPDVPTTEDI